jgi:mono/diheme cytochrome c family protein
VALVVWTMAVPLAAQFGRATRPQVIPPQGPVRQVIFDNCTLCHGIDDYAYSALDRAGWDAYLDETHAGMDVPIPAASRAILLDWLAERFGPETRPFPRTYVAQEVTSFFSDTGARQLLDRACASCHELDRVDNARFSPDRWRVIALDMRERGAKLEDDELERLVEWLGRTRGTNDSDRQ